MIQRTILLLLLLIFFGCNGDYSKDLGNGYSLERTNACCIFVMRKQEDVELVSAGESIGRDIKPIVKELYINNTYITGLKESNKCCYLDEDEKKHNTPNGYFIINKTNGKMVTGLKKYELKKYNIELRKMKKIL